MRAALDDSSIFQDKDDISLADGCEAMSDHDTGPALHQPVEGIENDGFGYSIESGRWLVENENGSIADDGASDPDALTLASGNRDTALADHSLVSIRQLLDEIVRIPQLVRSENPLSPGPRFSIRGFCSPQPALPGCARTRWPVSKNYRAAWTTLEWENTASPNKQGTSSGPPESTLQPEPAVLRTRARAPSRRP